MDVSVANGEAAPLSYAEEFAPKGLVPKTFHGVELSPQTWMCGGDRNHDTPVKHLSASLQKKEIDISCQVVFARSLGTKLRQCSLGLCSLWSVQPIPLRRFMGVSWESCLGGDELLLLMG